MAVILYILLGLIIYALLVYLAAGFMKVATRYDDIEFIFSEDTYKDKNAIIEIEDLNTYEESGNGENFKQGA